MNSNVGKNEQTDQKAVSGPIKIEPRWVTSIFFIMRIVFPFLLFFLIVWSYSHLPLYGSILHIIILTWTLFAYLTFDRIWRFKIGPFSMEKEKPQEVFTKEQKAKVQTEVEEPVRRDTQLQIFLAKHELNRLLSNYSFFYGRQQGLTNVIRFSDAFSGRPLRYINHFSQDLNAYLSSYSKYLKHPLIMAIEALKDYVDNATKYHKKEELLSAPTFSVQEYVRLVNNIVQNFKPDNFQSPS